MFNKMMIITVVGVLAIMTIGCGKPDTPSKPKMSEESQRKNCLGNLRMVNQAIESVAFSNNIKEGQVVSSEILAQFMHHETMRDCPSGSKYIIHPLGQYPTCPTHGNLLKETKGPCVLPYQLRKK